LSGSETTSARGRRVAVFLDGLPLALVAFIFLALTTGHSLSDDLGGAPTYLLIVFVGVPWRARTSAPRNRSAYLLGMLAGTALLAGGLAAWAGIWPTLGAVVLLDIVIRLLTRRVPEPAVAAPAPAAESAPYVLLLGAVIACAVALMAGYMPAARASAYALAELGTAFLLGALATLALWRRAARLPGAPVAAALVVIAVALVNALSFFGYPSLLVSGTAVLQTSSYLLTPGRVFPFYALAFLLGVPAGLLWCGAAPRLGRKVVWAAPMATVVAAGLLARWTYVGPYLLAVGLALAAAVVAWSCGPRGSLALRVATVATGALGLVWLTVGDPHMGWAGLRMTLGSILRESGLAGRPVSVRLSDGMWGVVLEDADVRATFLNGNLIDFTRKGGTDQLSSVRACVALGLAYAPAEGRLDTVEPELGTTSETLNALAPRRRAPEPGAKCALIVSGPGPLTAAVNPLSALNTDHLGCLKRELADGGVLAMWLPAGNLHVDALRRALATVGAVFPRYDVYLEGRGAVVIAGGTGQVPYGRLAALFRDDAAREMLAGAGFLAPADLLTGYVGSSEDLADLTEGARPYSDWFPSRPAAMALDLAEPPRPTAVLALAQYRELGPERLVGRLQFGSPAQKIVALRGFSAIYADETSRTLGALGATGPDRRLELIGSLPGPYVRLDLLAPGQKERVAQLASVLCTVGMRESAATVLKDAIQSGHDTFEANVELAAIEEAQAARAAALKHLRRALELKPDSDAVRGHVVALLLSTGRADEAVEELKDMVKRKPDDLTTLLELGYLYAKLQRGGDAADIAERVLKIDPGNPDADALLKAAGKTAPAERSAASEQPGAGS
jgi:tetratricopeptide (TPR) repeat protein